MRHRRTSSPFEGAVHRTAAALLAVSCALLVSLGSGTSASAATGSVPNRPGLSGQRVAPLTAPPATPPAQLTLANVVVTDLATGDASLYSYDDPAPIYPSNINCNTEPGELLCMNFGDGPGPNGGSFLLLENPFQAGGIYNGDTMNVSVDNQRCGTGTGGNVGATATTEVDQYVYTSGATPVQKVALQFDCTNSSIEISGTIAYNIVPTDPGNGYYLFGHQGDLTGFDNDNYIAYLDGARYQNLNAPIVGMAATPDGAGYWMAGSDGGVFASGDAPFYGSTGNLHLNKPVVSMAATPDGKGYWFVASDGGIFAYGDAGFYGSTGNLHLNKPIVGMASTPSGHGYWLVASDGGIFAYGDAGFYGSTGNLHLNKPVVGMASTPSGHGYWFVASDGGIFAYGDAGFYGSTGSLALAEPIVGMAAAPDGHGYWFTASDGGVFNYGSAGFAGSLAGAIGTDGAGIALGT
jgi:hypothetical protein